MHMCIATPMETMLHHFLIGFPALIFFTDLISLTGLESC